MTRLPTSLSIALWLTAAAWVVGLIAYLLHAPKEIVEAALVIGLGTAAFEWFGRRKRK